MKKIKIQLFVCGIRNNKDDERKLLPILRKDRSPPVAESANRSQKAVWLVMMYQRKISND